MLGCRLRRPNATRAAAAATGPAQMPAWRLDHGYQLPPHRARGEASAHEAGGTPLQLASSALSVASGRGRNRSPRCTVTRTDIHTDQGQAAAPCPGPPLRLCSRPGRPATPPGSSGPTGQPCCECEIGPKRARGGPTQHRRGSGSGSGSVAAEHDPQRDVGGARTHHPQVFLICNHVCVHPCMPTAPWPSASVQAWLHRPAVPFQPVRGRRGEECALTCDGYQRLVCRPCMKPSGKAAGRAEKHEGRPSLPPWRQSCLQAAVALVRRRRWLGRCVCPQQARCGGAGAQSRAPMMIIALDDQG